MGDSIFKPYDLQISLQNRPLPPFTMIEVGSAWVVFFSSFDALSKGIAHFPRGLRFLIKKYFIIVNGGQGAIQTNPIGFKNRIPHLDFFFSRVLTFLKKVGFLRDLRDFKRI